MGLGNYPDVNRSMMNCYGEIKKQEKKKIIERFCARLVSYALE